MTSKRIQYGFAFIGGIINAGRVNHLYETQLSFDAGVDVGFVGVDDGSFGFGDDVHVLGGGNVVAGVGLSVGLAEGIEGVYDLHIIKIMQCNE